VVTWITGNSGSGKTTLAKRMRRGEVLLDGDTLRAIWPGLTLSPEDRRENNLRAARLAAELDRQGFDVIVATICPYRDLRDEVQRLTKCKFISLDGGKEGPEYPYER
jgi:adenylylsulfate kinase